MKIPESPLGGGKTIPVIGFGTAEYPFTTSKEAVKESALNAIKTGYRHFDTAALYKSEKYLGEAIAEGLSLGVIKSRDEVFVTSKLWISDAHPHLVLPALQTTLRNLGLEYIDLYLIHFPASLKPGTEYPFKAEDALELDYENVWKAMEECQRLGLTKSIGVSNFSCKKLEKVLAVANIPPAVNQVEMNPIWQQKKLRDFCKEKGIHITAYSPLGAKGTPWGSERVLQSQLLQDIANKHQKTLAQVCLRWAYEQGVSVIVKSFNKGRMEENLNIFDWELSPEDVEKIEQIPQKRGSTAENYITENGPFKSLDDIWDGEM